MADKVPVQIFFPRTRHQWRKWLEKNHAKEKNVKVVIIRKNATIKGIRYDDAVEEALCFGWIDSTTNKRDDDSYIIHFAQRNPRSRWSQSNHIRVAKLIREGKMMPSGQAVIDHAKKTGSWDVVENLKVPSDLKKHFAKNKTALKNFNSFSPSSQQIILGWILDAKRPETRQRRIDKTVELAAKNLKSY